MSEYIVLDLAKHQQAWTGGILTPANLTDLAKHMGRPERTDSKLDKLGLWIICDSPLGAAFYSSGFMSVHEALFYDFMYADMRRVLKMRKGPKTATMQFWTLPRPWRFTKQFETEIDQWERSLESQEEKAEYKLLFRWRNNRGPDDVEIERLLMSPFKEL